MLIFYTHLSLTCKHPFICKNIKMFFIIESCRNVMKKKLKCTQFTAVETSSLWDVVFLQRREGHRSTLHAGRSLCHSSWSLNSNNRTNTQSLYSQHANHWQFPPLNFQWEKRGTVGEKVSASLKASLWETPRVILSTWTSPLYESRFHLGAECHWADSAEQEGLHLNSI